MLKSKLGKQPQGCDMTWKLVLIKHNNRASLPKGKLGKFIPLEFFFWRDFLCFYIISGLNFFCHVRLAHAGFLKETRLTIRRKLTADCQPGSPCADFIRIPETGGEFSGRRQAPDGMTAPSGFSTLRLRCVRPSLREFPSLPGRFLYMARG